VGCRAVEIIDADEDLTAFVVEAPELFPSDDHRP
jgi:hypothetical protein